MPDAGYVTAVTYGSHSNVYLDSLIGDYVFASESTGSSQNITVQYTYQTGTDNYGYTGTGLSWPSYAQTAMEEVFQAYENVLNVTFEKTNGSGWDLALIWGDSTAGLGFSGWSCVDLR